MLNIQRLSNEFKIPPWSFVPLVTCQLDVLCGLEITLLRKDHPGSSIWSGDIDNRIKTIIDALEVPDANSGYADIEPDEALNPLFCLLQNDQLLTSVAVETGRLLDPLANEDQSYAHISIRVRIRPEKVTMLNLGL